MKLAVGALAKSSGVGRTLLRFARCQEWFEEGGRCSWVGYAFRWNWDNFLLIIEFSVPVLIL